jgi:hypothetical protein
MTGQIKIQNYHKITNAETGIKTETEAARLLLPSIERGRF